ncbi:thiamine pyrophosphate-binding protein [Nonomuraea sp. KC401]|uniref:thiamine pyrophosphate-dependent enzyme n=1 Tax=unclassified Nonomuraea TaxID=2593643 RepID=UPI0010FE5593|nr:MULTISPECIES: thiamine pyrophosphate-dependent enzyme [unclassified Nonomuraea]NBE92794.1 thiamine pyrophosphate-binding protein [Nonomuraea sp. K271]TLF81807.1 thiamine pyrophosphate-binding protein [Nonomuraea sp. KC401]
MSTVRDAAFDVLRSRGLTTIFCNPGSTEVPLLTDLPDDLRFVLALHEASVVGMATGWAIGTEAPALVVLHTTAGLGTAVGAIATARVNRAPLVILVGQQDRRHVALEPFLTGRLEGLAGDYPVWADQPARAQDVPGALARAWHEAVTARGPALVIVPMDDWRAPFDGEVLAAPARLLRPAAVPDADLAPLVQLLTGARSPAIVAGAGAAWDPLVALAERLRCPVFQESFGARAGFPQDHPQYAGVLPADRARLRERLAPHDVVLAVGAPVFRQYVYAPGPLVAPGTSVALVTDDPAEAHRSPADLAYLASPAAVCARLTTLLPTPTTSAPRATAPGASPSGPDDAPLRGRPLRAAHVLSALASRLPADTVLVEETPSSRPDLHRLVPARTSLGFVSAAMGGLGFGVPAAVGLRMALPDRPVVAVVGDGAALYGLHALWSATHYRVGALFVVLANGRYAVMDRLADNQGGKAPWPPFTEVDVRGLARSLGCPARRVDSYDELTATLDEVVPNLPAREEPLLLDVTVAVDLDFQP